MSVEYLIEIRCDYTSCNNFVPEHSSSVAAARQKAKEEGWKIGRGDQPDLCPMHKHGEPE